MASETQGVADFTQAVREAAEKLLGPHSLVEMREWSGWETPLPSRFVFHLLGERVPDSIRESADDDQQLICGWLRAAQERARLGRRATPPWMALSSAPAELHRYLRTIGAEKRAALARDASERELRNEESRRRLAAHTDAAKGRFSRVRALRHLPPPSMHVLTTTLPLPHRCVRSPRQSAPNTAPSTSPSTPKTARGPLTTRAGPGSRL